MHMAGKIYSLTSTFSIVSKYALEVTYRDDWTGIQVDQLASLHSAPLRYLVALSLDVDV